MCGIAGILGKAEDTTRRIRQMIDAESHRGPDDSGVLHRDHVTFGHRRLSILDPTPLGHQPMVSPDERYAVVFNGEIYNFHQLRSSLSQRGYRFRSDSDTEVLLHAAAEWGSEVVERLNGDFAFAFHDFDRQRTLLARDRLGVKPLYYAELPKGVVFASEIRSLLASGLVERRLNSDALPEYLATQSVAPPRTLVDDIRLLEPGHLAVVEDGVMNRHTYWTPLENRRRDVGDHGRQQVKDNVRRLLQQAIERQMVSDVPLGAFLSGGLDSTAVVGLMSQCVEEPIRTVALTFEDSGFDDGRYARIAADAFSAEHVEVSLSNEEIQHHARQSLRAQDHPSKDGINTYVVSKAARDRGLKVALSGVGGDELFAGYSIFSRMRFLNRVSWLWEVIPPPIRSLLSGPLSAAEAPIAAQKLGDLLQTDGSFASLYGVMRRFLFSGQIERLLKEPGGSLNPLAARLGRDLTDCPSLTTTTKVSVGELRSYLHNVLLRDTDQMSMTHSLEVRVPLLDHDLVEYMLGVNDTHKTEGPGVKPLLISALQELLPEEIVQRPKQGFHMPFARWFRGPLQDLVVDNLDVLRNRPEFRSPEVDRIWGQFLKGQSNISASRILLLVSLGCWIRENL